MERRTKRLFVSGLGVISYFCFMVCACTETYTPKPRGYFRIEPEAATYQPLALQSLPYSFEVSSLVRVDSAVNQQEGWINLVYPDFHATLYCSYLSLRGVRLHEALTDGRKLAQKQQAVEALREKTYADPNNRIYASLYLLNGDCVSPIQFTVTDSATHFFRGALYYEFHPKADSIAPVTEYVQKDIIHLIETFEWN